MKYETLCNDILNVVAKENIQDVFCCVTRLRLIVKDKSAIDRSALENINGVIQVKEVGNQLQLVIGPHVQDVYREFCAVTGFKEKDAIGDDDETPAEAAKQTPLEAVMATLSSIFAPIIPAFCTGGMIKCIVLLLTTFGVLSDTSGEATLLNLIGDAPFYFLPFLVGFTTAKQFKINQIFGIMIAGCLMYPALINQTAGESIHFLFFDVPAYSYATSVLPVILCTILFSYLFRAIDRVIPANVRLVFSGTIAFAVFVPFLLGFIAPLGNWCGNALSGVIMALFNTAGPLAGALFTGVLPLLIMTGMHWALDPVQLQNFASFGWDPLMPAFLVSNFAVAGATIAASLRIRHADKKAAAFSNGAMGILGITEPALYSIDIPYKQPLIGAIVGGAAGGAAYMFLGVKCYVYSMPGIFSLAAYVDDGSNVLFAMIAMAVGFIAAFAYSFMMTKDVETEVQ